MTHDELMALRAEAEILARKFDALNKERYEFEKEHLYGLSYETLTKYFSNFADEDMQCIDNPFIVRLAYVHASEMKFD